MHKKYTHYYYINEPEKKSEPIIIVKDEASSTDFSPAKDLRKKDSLLDHATILEALSHHRKKLYAKEKKYFFVQTADQSSFSRPFDIKVFRKAPDAMKVKYPKEGGLCLSIHINNHYVSLFVDFKEKTMVYYDSFGTPMNKEIQAFVQKIRRAVFKPKDKVKQISVNAHHQHDLVNCGRYTINFLKEMMDSSNLDRTIATLKDKTLSSDQIYKEGLKWAKELSSK
jgi:hypothetical protein